MFYPIICKPVRAVFAACTIACAGLIGSAVAEEKVTYGAIAVDVSVDRGEPLRERQAQRLKEWRERAAERRAAFKKRLEERREKRLSGLRSVRLERGEQNRSHRRNLGARAEDDSWTWYQAKPRKKGNKVQKEQKTISAPTVTPKGKFGALIAKYAKQHGVPYSLARAVVQVESTFRPHVTGGAGEIGLMQIKLATARGMGYKGSRKQLYNPATNLYWGMKYLGKAHQLAGGSTCGTILRYNAGHGAKRMNKVSSRYCGKVKRILA